MTQYRWVVLKVGLSDGQVETAEGIDGSIEEYIEQELAWSRDSFESLDIIEISDEYDNTIEMDGE